MKYLIIIMLLIPATVNAEEYVFRDWTQADLNYQIAGSVLHVADWLQTREIATNDEYKEEWNPILGENPSMSEVNTYMAVSLITTWIVADLLPPKWRRRFQYVYIGVEAAAVANNVNLGIGFKF